METEHRATILFVEDDDAARIGVRKILQASGYRVLTATDQADAIENLAHGDDDDPRCDLVLLDLGRPSDEVLSVGRCIREQARSTVEIPVVVINAAPKVDPALEGTNVSAGGRDFVCYWEQLGQLTDLLGTLTGKQPKL